MFLSKILRFIRGFVRVEISGPEISKFLNYLNKNNLYIWNISKIKNKIYINIFIKNYIDLYKLSRNYNIKIKINNKYGLFFIIKKYKKRFGLAFGFLFFIIFLLTMSQFIWTVEVHGNKTIESKQIIDFISSKQIRPGRFRKNIDVRSIEREILLKFKKISWVSINILGSKANIEINERTFPPKKIDIGKPCNIVASKKGVIKNIEAYQGQNLVEIGDFFEKKSNSC
ncbi:MAG: sporulation protein YqfD [Oscillospiraceae bacterium]|nr:sporulation protein YqfD [Oscillospiraceae bacterium]